MQRGVVEMQSAQYTRRRKLKEMHRAAGNDLKIGSFSECITLDRQMSWDMVQKYVKMLRVTPTLQLVSHRPDDTLSIVQTGSFQAATTHISVTGMPSPPYPMKQNKKKMYRHR